MRLVRTLPVLVLLAATGASTAHAQIEFRVYGDSDYRFDASDSTVEHSFQLPLVDLFATGDYDRWSFLSETAFEYSPDNGLAIDVERAQITYLVNDHLRVSAGRFHSAFGFYNDTYHHGSYHQLTAARPDPVQFEDRGGLIPAHSIGVHLDGRFAFNNIGRLRYDFEVTNGRGATADMVLNVTDLDLFKALNARLRFEPAFADDLVFGVNVFFDRLPSDASRVDLDQLIVGAHVAYLGERLHLVGEGFVLQNRVRAASGLTTNFGAFVELGFAFRLFEPYAAFSATVLASDDPYFVAAGGFETRKVTTVGLKLTFNEHVAMRLEGRYTHRGASTSLFTGLVQVSYVF